MFSCEVGSLILWSAMRFSDSHYEHAEECRFYSVLLLCGFPWPDDVFWLVFWLGWTFPMFPPKKKSHEELVEAVHVFVTAHGRVPTKRDEVEAGRKLYNNLQKNKTLGILEQYSMERGVLLAVDVFYTEHARLPRRTKGDASEDNLARRWLRVQKCCEDGELAADLIDAYSYLFDAAAKLEAAQVEEVCRDVEVFLQNHSQLPQRRDRNASEEAR